MKILLIEDEKVLAGTLQDLLTAKGFQVDVVHDGESGVEYAMLGIYDLLILDAFRRPIFSMTLPMHSSGTSATIRSIGSQTLPSISLVRTLGVETENS